MSNRTRRSARKELKGIVERALEREAGIPDDATRRVVNRILRQSSRIAEISELLRTAETARPPSSQPQAPQEFDPYAFGAVVTLQKLGAEALMDRLHAIKSIENLRSLAAAQNLSIPVEGSNSDELRAAIVRGAEQRLAERRAAAS